MTASASSPATHSARPQLRIIERDTACGRDQLRQQGRHRIDDRVAQPGPHHAQARLTNPDARNLRRRQHGGRDRVQAPAFLRQRRCAIRIGARRQHAFPCRDGRNGLGTAVADRDGVGLGDRVAPAGSVAPASIRIAAGKGAGA